MTILRRVERCPDHNVVPMFATAGTVRQPDDEIVGSWRRVRGCRYSTTANSRLMLPLILPPLVVAG